MRYAIRGPIELHVGEGIVLGLDGDALGIFLDNPFESLRDRLLDFFLRKLNEGTAWVKTSAADRPLLNGRQRATIIV